jgi:hypothetical protein
MAKRHGRDGSITFAGGYVVNADNWAADIEADEHDTTDFTAGAVGFAEYTTGLLRGTVTAEGFAESATALILPGVSGASTMLIDGTEGFSGTLHETNFSIGATVNEMVRWTMTARFSGTITVVGTP